MPALHNFMFILRVGINLVMDKNQIFPQPDHLPAEHRAAGFQHNHSREFEKIEDKVMLDYMLENTDPDKVLFEMDVYWTVMGKASPVDYFKKYPGRFRLLHIKDRREIGQSGMVGFDAIFANAREAGVENIIVEIEGSSYNDIVRSVRECADYLLEAPFVTAFFRDK